ncbi:MAG: 50S ribosomal protein L10 [Sedimentisphaerales bacterium]|nr:50S ribosomal protein L10 [Sedimentisphaerales bacterium]
MSKSVKQYIQKELKQRYENVNELIVVSVRGIKGVDNNIMRGDLLDKQIRLNVVSNSLAGRVFDDLGMAGVREVLVGPSAVVYGADDIVDLAKVLVEWEKKLEAFQIKGGYLEGKVLDAEAAKALSKLPSRVELQGTVVAIAISPGARVAGLLGSPGGRIAGCIKALIEKLEAA